MTDDTFYNLLGWLIIYVVIHFYVIQFQQTWNQRTAYGKLLTIAAAVSTVLIFIGLSQ